MAQNNGPYTAHSLGLGLLDHCFGHFGDPGKRHPLKYLCGKLEVYNMLTLLGFWDHNIGNY